MIIRKHAPPEAYRDSYLYPINLFEPLDYEEIKDMGKGNEIFRKNHPLTKLFPDPFFAAGDKPPSCSLQNLSIVAPDHEMFQQAAMQLSATLRDKYGCNVPILAEDDPASSLSATGPLLLFGGANRNRRSMEIAKKYQVGAFSSSSPGVGGWAITTHEELEDGVSWRTILTFDASTADEALATFVNRAIISSANSRLAWQHHVSPGQELMAALPDFDTWLRLSKSNMPLIQTWLTSDRSRPFREVFFEATTMDYPDGYPWTATLVDIPIACLRFYELTGDEQALDVFREMLWGFWNYLQSENPQMYIADMDFRLGLIYNYWNWISHHPSFTAEEHTNFRLLFLATTRMVNDYFEIMWKHRPAPFNHQTHKARTLLCGWRYFRRWNVPDLAQWKDNAESIFHQVDLGASKFREDAAGYERFVPEHLLNWREITNQSIPEEMQNGMLRFTQRDWAMRDNFMYPVDYGDAEPVFARVRPFEVSPWLTLDTPEQLEMKALESSCSGLFPLTIPAGGFQIFVALHQENPQKSFPETIFTGWMLLPLDPSFAETYSIQGPEDELFDKLVWRSGWKADSSYLALQGLGKGPDKKLAISHAHHEANSILRMNLGGRIWLINNGYGKKANPASPADAISTRQIGPEDHNTLIVRTSGIPVLPPMRSLLKHFDETPIPVSVSELSGYGEVNWRRYLIVLPGMGFIIIDDVLKTENNPETTVELQWNALGELTEGEKETVLTQSGVQLVINSFGTSVSQWRESSIATWRAQIVDGNYHHTKTPPHQLVQLPDQPKMPHCCFVNGFWLKDSVRSVNWDAASRRLSIQTDAKLVNEAAARKNSWFEIQIEANYFTIELPHLENDLAK